MKKRSDRRRVSESVLAEFGEGGRSSERITRGSYVVQHTPAGDRWYIPLRRTDSEIDVIQEPVAPSVVTCEPECRRV